MSPTLTTVEALEQFVSSAKPWESAIYHSGSLPHDRELDPELNALAGRVLHMAKNGHVILLQKRHGDLKYDYIVVLVPYQDSSEGVESEEEANVE